MKRLLPLVGLVSCLVITDSFAGSATWNLNPANADWNTATNWTPNTVPNGPSDIATFDSSTTTTLSISAGVELDSVVFEPGASGFAINTNSEAILTLSGQGVINNSGVVQTVVVRKGTSTSGELHFTNSATAGDSVSYVNWTHNPDGVSPVILFQDASNAGSAEFFNHAGFYGSRAGLIEFQGNSSAANGKFHNIRSGDEQPPTINFRDQASAGQGVFDSDVYAEGVIAFYDSSTADQAKITSEGAFDFVLFYNNSSAGNATITNDAAYYIGSDTLFYDNSTAGNGTFIVNAGHNSSSTGWGTVQFNDTSTAGTGTFIASGAEFAGTYLYGGIINITSDASADHGTFYADGGKVAGALGGEIFVDDTATAEAATFYLKGGAVDGALGGRLRLSILAPSAANSTLIATGGVGTGVGAGGGILLEDHSTGDEARVELEGNGFLDLRPHFRTGVTIGSLEGDGLVYLGSINLSVGSNNLNTKFSGVIQEGIEGVSGALTKIGSGNLTLTGANRYTGPTTIESGKLIVNNPTHSGTGSGPVAVNAGVLAGRGTIAGAVAVGTGTGPGATLAPGETKAGKNSLIIQGALTFNSDSTYDCGLNSQTVIADKVVANGVVINSGRFTLRDSLGLSLTAGTVLTVIDNTSANPISGTFANLADGSTVTIGVNKLQVSYSGGDGNDLTLTVVQ